MMELIERWLPNLYSYWYKFLANCAATFQMFIISGAISFVFGMIFGVLLIVFKKDGINLEPVNIKMQAYENLLQKELVDAN